MIIGFSTSSPWASVALISVSGEVLWSGVEQSEQNASFLCLTLLDAGLNATGLSLQDASLFAADAGPGSFTGVRVGVMLAKTLAWTQSVQCTSADAFDLIAHDRLVALPSKKGEYFVRQPGSKPFTQKLAPVGGVGYGLGGEDTPPTAARFASLIPSLTPVAPEELVPRYLIEASISQPKNPLWTRSPA